MFDLRKLWPLEPQRVTWGQIWDHTSDRPFRCVSAGFCRLPLPVIVWSLDRLNCTSELLTEKCEHFAMMTSFHTESIDLGSLNLYINKFLYGPTYPPNFMYLALTRAEIVGGGGFLPPPPSSRVRNYQTLSRERVYLTNRWLNERLEHAHWSAARLSGSISSH